MNQTAEQRVGTVIRGKWRVDSLLGAGAMAAVYGVTHRNGARAALKLLHPALCADPAVCERFLGEGYLTNSVKHSGILRVFDDGMTEDGCVFLVMDLLEGRTLDALRLERGGQLGVGEVLRIGNALMDVLHVVHAAELIHRDLKPQNVFICDDGSVKLLDFGIARVLDQAAQSKVSRFGVVLGTPSFMSPEQASGARERVDHRSDIWSLGATLFTALTGQTVHLGPSVQARLLSAATAKARSIAVVRPDLPAPIVAAIDTALRFKPEERWQTIDAFRRAFAEARVQLAFGSPDGQELQAQAERAPSVDDAIAVTECDFEDELPARESGAPALARVHVEAQEISFPAVGHTLEPERHRAGVRGHHGSRRSRLGVWLAAAAIAVVGVSGVALFAPPSADALAWVSSSAQPRSTPSAAPPTPTVELKEPIPVAPPDLLVDASAPLVTPATALPRTRPFQAAAAAPARRHDTVPPPSIPAIAPTPDPAPAPSLAPPDPFGTPQ